MAGTIESVDPIDPTDSDGEVIDGGPGTKPPPKRSAPPRDGEDATVNGGPGTKPPPKLN